MSLQTFEQLQQQHFKALALSEQAIRRRPDLYRQIRALLCRIVNEPVDVGEYYRLARTLAALLETLGGSQPGCIFEYYQKHIDPRGRGEARTFRMECRDMLEQLSNFEQWRKENRRLTLVPSSPFCRRS